MIHARVYIRDMTNVSNVITLEQLARDFDGLFKRRAFRLETRDYYDAPNEREPYARFLAGEPVDPAWREPWMARVRAIRETGRIMQRVKVVSEPADSYARFSLLHGAPASVEAGEDVRIISRRKAHDEWLAFHDYWLFDDGLAAILVYDDSGRVVRVELNRDATTLEWFCGERDDLLALASPLAQYVAKHNITERKYAA
jgi:hypothetical protein